MGVHNDDLWRMGHAAPRQEGRCLFRGGRRRRLSDDRRRWRWRRVAVLEWRAGLSPRHVQRAWAHADGQRQHQLDAAELRWELGGRDLRRELPADLQLPGSGGADRRFHRIHRRPPAVRLASCGVQLRHGATAGRRSKPCLRRVRRLERHGADALRLPVAAGGCRDEHRAQQRRRGRQRRGAPHQTPVTSKSQSLSEQADRALGARGRPTAATRARRCRAATRRARARRTAIGQAARPRTVGAPS